VLKSKVVQYQEQIVSLFDAVTG